VVLEGYGVLTLSTPPVAWTVRPGFALRAQGIIVEPPQYNSLLALLAAGVKTVLVCLGFNELRFRKFPITF
jgi:hypothetical protein